MTVLWIVILGYAVCGLITGKVVFNWLRDGGIGLFMDDDYFEAAMAAMAWPLVLVTVLWPWYLNLGQKARKRRQIIKKTNWID